MIQNKNGWYIITYFKKIYDKFNSRNSTVIIYGFYRDTTKFIVEYYVLE